MARPAKVEHPEDEALLESEVEYMAHQLRNARMAANKSVGEVARSLGISDAMVIYLESGRRIPSYQTMLKLMRYYKQGPSLFFNIDADYSDLGPEELTILLRYLRPHVSEDPVIARLVQLWSRQLNAKCANWQKAREYVRAQVK